MILAARLFTVLAAVMGVASVALAALLSVDYALADALVMARPDAIQWLQDHTTPWFWNNVQAPLLVRPSWIIPAMLGLLFGGAATSVSLRNAAPSRGRN